MRALAFGVAWCLASATAHQAHAESCTGLTGSGGRFATCFDPGNRLSLTAGSDGFGGSVALRHVIHFDDEPDLVWKLEHTLLDGTHAGVESRFAGVLYRGRYVRHSRDGHIVIPLGTPKKVFLPFDVGAMTEVGKIYWRPEVPISRFGVVKAAVLIDLARSRNFRRRLAVGPVVRWDVDVDRDEMVLAQHIVSPFSSSLANIHLESNNGRTIADLTLEAGSAWHSKGGWKSEASAEASLERIVVAINDRPIALVLGVRYDSVTDETTARIGARVVLVHRRDPRVSLDPPRKR